MPNLIVVIWIEIDMNIQTINSSSSLLCKLLTSRSCTMGTYLSSLQIKSNAAFAYFSYLFIIVCHCIFLHSIAKLGVLLKYFLELISATSSSLLCPDCLNCYAHISDGFYTQPNAKSQCSCLGGHLINTEPQDEYNEISAWLTPKGQVSSSLTTCCKNVIFHFPSLQTFLKGIETP